MKAAGLAPTFVQEERVLRSGCECLDSNRAGRDQRLGTLGPDEPKSNFVNSRKQNDWNAERLLRVRDSNRHVSDLGGAPTRLRRGVFHKRGRRSFEPPSCESAALAKRVRSDVYEFRIKVGVRDLGTVVTVRLYRQRTSDSIFLRILEAPPGFEPGMEVLQIGPDCLGC